jgi:hypothetical protein
MMFSMAVFPGEIGNKKARMENKPNCVINPREIVECMVATFMCYNPYTSEHTFISCPVPKPESPSQNALTL